MIICTYRTGESRIQTRLARRHRVGLASVALASVVAVVAGSLAISHAVSHPTVQRVSTAGQPGVP